MSLHFPSFQVGRSESPPSISSCVHVCVVDDALRYLQKPANKQVNFPDWERDLHLHILG